MKVYVLETNKNDLAEVMGVVSNIEVAKEWCATQIKKLQIEEPSLKSYPIDDLNYGYQLDDTWFIYTEFEVDNLELEK